VSTADQAINNSNLMLELLQDWARAGWIRWLDAELAAFLYQQTQPQTPAPPLLLLAAALTSHQSGHGHVALDLRYCLAEPDQALSLPPEHALHTPVIRPANVLSLISLEQWLSAIAHNTITEVRFAPDSPSNKNVANIDSGNTPLVLTQSSTTSPMLYLRRFWRYEQQISKAIHQRLMYDTPVDSQALTRILGTLFPDHTIDNQSQETHTTSAICDWQKIACALAACSHFAIITGGPGTGKTTTVVRLLKVLDELKHTTHPLRIKLAAPTGKAAVRLSESIAAQRTQIKDSENIPTEVSTVHRLLGPIPDSRFFRHNAGNPLPVDVVVVDEASMVDVELMAQLMEALPANARLILLGDKDQLASVEAGAVLGSLCGRADNAHYRPATIEWLQQICGQSVPADMTDAQGTALDQAIIMLRYSHRFGRIPGIGKLAQAVNRNSDQLLALFDGRHAELKHLPLKSTRDTVFEFLVRDDKHGYGYYLQVLSRLPALKSASTDSHNTAVLDNWAMEVLTAFGQFQLLAALRKGEFGVEELNQRIESVLRNARLLTTPDTANSKHVSQPAHDWYAGRPVMLTRNDYALQLMNGDIGIVLPYPDASGIGHRLRVAFADSRQAHGIRWILPSRLQHVETVFAMTVHKSQGSEFTHTALILPPHDNPILTRELLYTAVTRASARFTLLSSNINVITTAASRRVFRVSGLSVLGSD
jgi:exodeoxyribonuclease V alpha subunit